ncbi:hypothetical protein K1T71_013159 [Dendrolimus kikuchii]|uniref:Uncharacterized protein n=1 Tax=Dendrolimus kikuchii TaxID=765133 RepID=A0ACC1CJJ5_9NEOP|nr:hypothetical protein K1T71_013159 [Dendrolimus kikuchii]
MGVLMQVICTGIICWICMNMGVMFSWPSSTYRLFESANTTLHRPMTEAELALFGSLSSVGALLGTPVIGMLLDKLGRKYCAIIGSLTGVISWAMIAASNRVEVLLTAIFVSGLSGSVFLVVPVYIGEFCQESIRGAMTSGFMMFYGIGMLVSYIIGGFLEYYSMVYICLTLSVLGTVLIAILKESPVYLMSRGLEEEAKKSIAYFRRVKCDDKEVLEEINNIRRALNPDMDSPDITPEEEKLKQPIEGSKKLSLWQFFKKSRSTRRAMMVCLILVTASIFQGLIVVQVYAEPLFEEAIPSMSSTLCSVLLAVASVLAGLGAAYLSESAGRRPLMIYSSFASGISCMVLGSQIHMRWGPGWVTAIFMYLFAVVFSVGSGIIPFVVIAEVFLPEVKSFISMLVVEWAWLCNSIILFIFNPLLKAIGLGPVFYLFATVCFFTTVFCWFCLPETKGMPVDAIQTLFNNKRRRIPVTY